MTESQFTSKLLKRLRQHPKLRKGEVWKVSDRFHAGRPDVQVIVNGLTTYFEMKKWPEGPTKIQAYYLARLAPRSWVVTFDTGLSTFMYSGARGNQFILRNDTPEQTITAIVARCIE